MNVYETLNYITKKALPGIEFDWNSWRIDEEYSIFQVAGWSNAVSDYVEDYFEEGLNAILKVIKKTEFIPEEYFYARQFVVAIANGTVNFHSDIASNKAGEACKLYKKNSVFREAVIEFAPYLYQLIPNLIEHFGGEQHFLHQQANDRKKKALCAENGVKLIEWPYTEEINESNLTKYLNAISCEKAEE